MWPASNNNGRAAFIVNTFGGAATRKTQAFCGAANCFARVKQIVPSSDGKTRTVIVDIGNGKTLRHSLLNLYPLEIQLQDEAPTDHSGSERDETLKLQNSEKQNKLEQNLLTKTNSERRKSNPSLIKRYQQAMEELNLHDELDYEEEILTPPEVTASLVQVPTSSF